MPSLPSLLQETPSKAAGQRKKPQAILHFPRPAAVVGHLNAGLPEEVTEYTVCVQQFHTQPLQRGEISLIFKATTSEAQAPIPLSRLNSSPPGSSPLIPLTSVLQTVLPICFLLLRRRIKWRPPKVALTSLPHLSLSLNPGDHISTRSSSIPLTQGEGHPGNGSLSI